MSDLPKMEELLEAGVHFGHQTGRWHPKAGPYIFGVRNNVHIIDLEATLKELEKAMDFARKTVASGGVVLFLGTKKQVRDIIKKHAIECEMPYLTERWLGGMLTNFGEVLTLLRKFKDLQRRQEKGEFKKYTKKEQLVFAREIEKLRTRIGGIQDLTKIPDAIYIVDLKYEKTARTEAETRGVKIIAPCDTNINPTGIDYPIPANDDAVKSIDLITGMIAKACKEGKAEAAKNPLPTPKPKNDYRKAGSQKDKK